MEIVLERCSQFIFHSRVGKVNVKTVPSFVESSKCELSPWLMFIFCKNWNSLHVTLNPGHYFAVSSDNYKIHDLLLPPCIKTIPTTATAACLENVPICGTYKAELALLDLYSGCGGMSSGLCLGTKLSCINLVTVYH